MIGTPYIYKITNTVNGKVYIGKTMLTVKERWREHCKDSIKERCKDRPLYRAMRKYGKDRFTIEQLEECDEKVLSDREIYWIDQYRSFRCGYNATLGGGGKSYIDYDKIVDTYQKIGNQREVARTLKVDTETVRKALEFRHVETMSRATVIRNLCGNKVQMFSLDDRYIKDFPSARDAAKFATAGKSIKSLDGAAIHISEVCKGKRKTAYGFKWKYA